MPCGSLTLPGRSCPGGCLGGWFGTAQRCGSYSALECTNPCSAQKKFLGGAEGNRLCWLPPPGPSLPASEAAEPST